MERGGEAIAAVTQPEPTVAGEPLEKGGATDPRRSNARSRAPRSFRSKPWSGRARWLEGELRLANSERLLAELHTELRSLAAHIRGNGEEGLLSQMRLSQEKILGLERQWKWVLRALIANLALFLKSLLANGP